MKSPSETPVIIYDGECRLCNRAIQFLKSEKTPEGIRFVPSSDPESSDRLTKHGIDPAITNRSVVFITDRKIYTKSTAVIKALQRKAGIWKLAVIILLIPKAVRDFIYDRIAERRNKIKKT